jgi:hypothetical protein
MYTFMFRHQIAGQIHHLMITNTSVKNVTNLKYLGTTLKNQNFTHDETKSKLISGNSSFNSVQNLLSSRLPCKNVKVKIHNYNFACCLYGSHIGERTQTEGA